MMELWPFTNFHDLNLDWIIKTLKTWVSNMNDVKNEIEEFMESGFKDDIEEVITQHPEWVTTVQDGAITKAKINSTFLAEIENCYVTPEMFGAVGDGISNDTQAIQDALDSGKYVMFGKEKTYKVSASSTGSHIAVSIPDNAVIFGNNATVVLEPNNYDRYRIFCMDRVKNIYISDINIEGDSDVHTGNTGEWGYGLAIFGSENVTCENVNVTNCWGDGFNIAATYAAAADSVMNYNITLKNVESSYCRRQGMSVEGVDGLTVNEMYIHHIAGTAPQTGIDFEASLFTDPYDNTTSKYEYINNVVVDGLRIEHTSSTPILFDANNSSKEGNYSFSNITIEGLRYKDNNNSVSNNLTFTNTIIKQNNKWPFEFDVNITDTVLTFENTVIDRDGSTTNTILMDGILKGAIIYDNLVIKNGGTQGLIATTVYQNDACKGLVINGLKLAGDAEPRYNSPNNERLSSSQAIVTLADNIISTRTGWFYPRDFSNIYYFDSTVTAATYIQAIPLYDNFEITIINNSSYAVYLERDANNRPDILYNDMTYHRITITSGILTIRYNALLNAWVTVQQLGTIS